MADLFSIIRTGTFTEYARRIEETGLKIKNSNGSNPLHMAIAYDRSDIAIDLLARGINVNDPNGEGMTALQTAIISGRTDLAREILKLGPDVNIRDNYGNNSLWYAVFYYRGNDELIRSILQMGGDAITKNKAGRSPIDFAGEGGIHEISELLASNA